MGDSSLRNQSKDVPGDEGNGGGTSNQCQDCERRVLGKENLG